MLPYQPAPPFPSSLLVKRRTESAPMLYICALIGIGSKHPSTISTCSKDSHHRDDDDDEIERDGARILAMGAAVVAAPGTGAAAGGDGGSSGNARAPLLLLPPYVGAGGSSDGGSCKATNGGGVKGLLLLAHGRPMSGDATTAGPPASLGRFRPIQWPAPPVIMCVYGMCVNVGGCWWRGGRAALMMPKDAMKRLWQAGYWRVRVPNEEVTGEPAAFSPAVVWRQSLVSDFGFCLLDVQLPKQNIAFWLPLQPDCALP